MLWEKQVTGSIPVAHQLRFKRIFLKYRLVFGLVVLLIISGSVGGCAWRNNEFTIRVSGTDGLEFSGEYGATLADGRMRGGKESKSVNGIVPTEYSITADVVWCSFAKQSEGGTLKVEIFKGNEVISESTTSIPYGVISLDAS